MVEDGGRNLKKKKKKLQTNSEGIEEVYGVTCALWWQLGVRKGISRSHDMLCLLYTQNGDSIQCFAKLSVYAD